MPKNYSGLNETNTKDNKTYKFNVPIRSSYCPSLNHMVSIDLYCHEKMPKEAKGRSIYPKRK